MLFLALMGFVVSENLSWFGPVSVVPPYLSGAISSHNLWIESYFRYDVLYVMGVFGLFLWLVRAAIIGSRTTNRSMRIFLPLAVICLLWKLQANYEEFIKTWASLVSLFWIPIIAVYLDSRNQMRVLSSLHGLNGPIRSVT